MPTPQSNQRELTQALLQHRGMLYGFIYSLVRDVNIAEEVFQEVAVVALQKARGSEPIRQPAKWLREVARRLVQAGFRTRSGRWIDVDPEYLEQIAHVFDSDPGVELKQQRMAALADCMEQISPENREVLRRRYVHGLTYAEIAQALGRSAGSLRVLVHRVQKALADCVQRRLSPEG